MEDAIPSIGLIGLGFVGGAMYKGFAGHTDIYCYDKDRNVGSYDEVANADIIFVAVPTPMHPDGSCDTRIIESVLENLEFEFKNRTVRKPVVIRSTVPPYFCARMAELYGGWMEIIFMPEFLTERTATLDFIQSSRFILGTDPDSFVNGRFDSQMNPDVMMVAELFRSRFPKTRIPILTWQEASLVKYATNTFFTIKLSFFNELFGVCGAAGANPDNVIGEVLEDGRIGRSHFAVPGHDGDFGWGGHCFPKDNRAYAAIVSALGLKSLMADAAWDVNEVVRSNRDWERQIGRAVSQD